MTTRLAVFPMLAASLVGVQVGAAIVATRFVIEQTQPASLAMLRYLIGFLCLLTPLLLSTRVRFARRDVLPISLLGITQFGIVVALLNFALQFIPSSRAALIFATFPFMTMLLAAAVGHERLTLVKALGVFLTISGVAFALGDQAVQSGISPYEWSGELAVLASALCSAICSVFYRPYLRKYPAVQVGGFAMLVSVAFLAVLAAGEGFFEALPRFTPEGWLAVLFIGLSSGIGYYLLLWALGHTAPTNVTVFVALSPVTATVLGALLLAEPVSSLILLGLLLIALGLWLAHRQLPTSPHEECEPWLLR